MQSNLAPPAEAVLRASLCPRPRARRQWHCQSSATFQQAGIERKAPYWTGKSSRISQAINLAISNPAIWAVMRAGARRMMVKTAEKSGIPWQRSVQELQQHQELEEFRQQLEDPNVSYPDYYTQKFHGYDAGNLNWQAAWEVEAATAALAVRVFREQKLPAQEACDAMRNSFLNSLQAYCKRNWMTVRKAVDVGCAAGDSTRRLAAQFPEAQLMGVDLSPNFLALAELRRRQAIPNSPTERISYRHGRAESLPQEDRSQDLVTASYLMHELPAAVTREVLRDAHRVLRPGGVLALVDGDPWSEVYQNMPLPIATLMRSTEPWQDEYFALDLQAAMLEAGFDEITYIPVNHRHRIMLGVATCSDEYCTLS